MDHTGKWVWDKKIPVSYKIVGKTLEVYLDIYKYEGYDGCPVRGFLKSYGEEILPNYYNLGVYCFDIEAINYILSCWGIPTEELFEEIEVYAEQYPLVLRASFSKKKLVPYVAHIYHK